MSDAEKNENVLFKKIGKNLVGNILRILNSNSPKDLDF